MKALMLLAVMMFSLPAWSVTLLNQSFIFNQQQVSTDKELMNLAEVRLLECASQGIASCTLNLSKSTSEKLQDYLFLKYQVESRVSKVGLQVDTRKVVACNEKLQKALIPLKIRTVNDRTEKVEYERIYSESSNWTEFCLKKKMYSLDLNRRIRYEADLVSEGAPMAMTEQYYYEVMSLVKLYQDNLKVSLETKLLPVAIAQKPTFGNLWTAWRVEKREVPLVIWYTAK